MPFLSRATASQGDRDSLITPERTVSYRALDQAAERVAGRLLAIGIRPGEVVALKGHPDPSVLVALHGIWKAGGIVLPMNPRWTTAEEEKAVGLLRPRVALLGREMERVGEGLVCLDLEAGPSTGSELMEKLWHDAPPLPGGPGALGTLGDRTAAHLFTSGTSGEPRKVSVTFGNLRASALGVGERLDLRSSDRWLGSLSLAHVGGLAMASRAALLGSSLLLDGAFRTGRLLDLLTRGAFTHASLVPTMLYQLLDLWRGDPPSGALRCFLVGGDGVEEALLERALRLGLPLALTYGLTEATSQVATAPPDLVRAKPGTVGPPMPGVEIRIAQGGEILVRGPTVAPFQGAPDGWLHTGDLGRLDEDGHLWVTGRTSDRIISGGVNVDPGEVEAVLRTHPGVREAVVVGIPDREWGERVVAAVVPMGQRLVLAELDRLARSSFSASKRPRDFRVVPALPRNANGKVDREGVRSFFGSPPPPLGGSPEEPDS